MVRKCMVVLRYVGCLVYDVSCLAVAILNDVPGRLVDLYDDMNERVSFRVSLRKRMS